jgi:hypothetical protein
MVRQARGGGSISPETHQLLQQHLHAGHCRLSLRQSTCVKNIAWRSRAKATTTIRRCESEQKKATNCTVDHDPSSSSHDCAIGCFDVTLCSSPSTASLVCTHDECVSYDRLWLATGCQLAIDREVLLNNIRTRYPIPIVNGLPCLTGTNQHIIHSSDNVMNTNNECMK